MRLCTLLEGVNLRSDRMMSEERLMANMTTQNRVNRLLFSMLSFLLVLVLSGLLGCKQEAASTQARPIPEVSVVTVSPQAISDEPEFIGQTESSRPVEIRPQVTGILKERFFSEGRDVKKGERLYQIDPVPFQAAYLSDKARVSQ